MPSIPLTKGEIAIVDEEDFDLLSRFSWQVNELGYAVANVGVGRKHVTIERMHRIIMQPPEHLEVDHINGDRLDNRRTNLRLATHQQNMWNKRKQKNGSSIFKGVSWHKQNLCWRARINVNGKEMALGCFESELIAAKAYNAAAKHHFGEFAQLNNLEGHKDA